MSVCAAYFQAEEALLEAGRQAGPQNEYAQQATGRLMLANARVQEQLDRGFHWERQVAQLAEQVSSLEGQLAAARSGLPGIGPCSSGSRRRTACCQPPRAPPCSNRAGLYHRHTGR